MPTDDFPELFLTMCAEISCGYPKNVLIEILEELYANRSHTLGSIAPRSSRIKAYYF